MLARNTCIGTFPLPTENLMFTESQEFPSERDTPSVEQFCPYKRGVLWGEGALHAFMVLAAKNLFPF